MQEGVHSTREAPDEMRHGGPARTQQRRRRHCQTPQRPARATGQSRRRSSRRAARRRGHWGVVRTGEGTTAHSMRAVFSSSSSSVHTLTWYQWSVHPKSAHSVAIQTSAILPKRGSREDIHPVSPCCVMLLSRWRAARAHGTLPWKAGSCPTMPSERWRARINFCIAHWSRIHDRGSGPAMLLPYSFCPRDHVRNAGPLNHERISSSVRLNCVKTFHCTSSCPVMDRTWLMPESACQSIKRSHAAQSYQTRLYECVHTFSCARARRRT